MKEDSVRAFRFSNWHVGRCMYGFTLIELLVVFTLLAMLLSIAVPRYLTAMDNSKEKVRQQNAETIRDALDKFNADQGRFPSELQELVEKKYLKKIPLDPVSGTLDWVALKINEDGGVSDIAPPKMDVQELPPSELKQEDSLESAQRNS